MDPVSVGAIVRAGATGDKMAEATAEETKWFMRKLFGPMAEVMGEHWAERLRERNLDRLREKTEVRARRVEDRGDEPGVANPRVAAQVFEAAQYSDPEVVSEYLSGVLASSRSDVGEDDSGVAWSNVVARLSSTQLRLHYIIYASMRPTICKWGNRTTGSMHNTTIILPFDEVWVQGAFRSGEEFADAVDGLMREGLIGDSYAYGPLATVYQREIGNGRKIKYPHKRALRVDMTIHGVRLFLWGNGAGRLPATAYMDPDVELSPVDADEMPQAVPDTALAKSFAMES